MFINLLFQWLIYYYQCLFYIQNCCIHYFRDKNYKKKWVHWFQKYFIQYSYVKRWDTTNPIQPWANQARMNCREGIFECVIISYWLVPMIPLQKKNHYCCKKTVLLGFKVEFHPRISQSTIFMNTPVHSEAQYWKR